MCFEVREKVFCFIFVEILQVVVEYEDDDIEMHFGVPYRVDLKRRNSPYFKISIDNSLI